jgi:hypothetical protein
MQAANTNYVFVMLENKAIVLHINNSVYVTSKNENELIAAFKQYNISDSDTIMASSDVEFATEFGFAYDSEAYDWIDAAKDALNFRHLI